MTLLLYSFVHVRSKCVPCFILFHSIHNSSVFLSVYAAPNVNTCSTISCMFYICLLCNCFEELFTSKITAEI